LTELVSPLALQPSALFQIKAQPDSESISMKATIVTVVAICTAVTVFAEDKPAQLKDLKDKSSYSIGLNVGFNMKRQNVEINQEAFDAGMKDALSGRKPLLTEQEVRETMIAFEKDMQDKRTQLAQKNAGEAQKFLNENKGKEGVKTTASGLQYKVLKEGNGAQPKGSDTVSVNYRGTLTDGTEFDSSYKRGQPATFPVSGVIKGWTEALQLMKAGSKYQLVIPPDLGYGQTGQGSIPPNAVLVFEVELLEVKSPQTGTSSPSPPPAK
jgi:FKBP-type peptidyl-prolyl cis-trans isomerase FklB